jgi:CRP-like cAMP-binding protein
VRTTAPTRALVIAAPAFRTLLRRTPSMQMKVLEALAARLPDDMG